MGINGNEQETCYDFAQSVEADRVLRRSARRKRRHRKTDNTNYCFANRSRERIERSLKSAHDANAEKYQRKKQTVFRALDRFLESGEKAAILAFGGYYSTAQSARVSIKKMISGTDYADTIILKIWNKHILMLIRKGETNGTEN